MFTYPFDHEEKNRLDNPFAEYLSPRINFYFLHSCVICSALFFCYNNKSICSYVFFPSHSQQQQYQAEPVIYIYSSCPECSQHQLRIKKSQFAHYRFINSTLAAMRCPFLYLIDRQFCLLRDLFLSGLSLALRR